jgi:hypothetical protein
MADKPGKQETEAIDEIDRFLSTLPSLYIPEDMVEDTSFPKYVLKKERSVTLTGIFALVAWSVFVFALMTASRASPPQWAFWDGVAGQRSHAVHYPQYLLNAGYYLLGNCIVCIGGLAICFIQKIKLTSGTAINFYIVGGASLIGAAALIIFR